jgi:dinuclear metal center YbgI/SA1388 family protein
MFKDYCPNGLQVQGRASVKKIISGVTASEDLIDVAISNQADAILVHHGYFWKGEDPCVVGMKKSRLRKLLNSDVSLLAYHLPLDAHETYGNNAQLAHVLDFSVAGRFGIGDGPQLAVYTELDAPLSPAALTEHLETRLQRPPLHIASAQSEIKRVAWCTGAAQSYLTAAVAAGADAFISGEVSEQTFHEARELGIHYYGAGHHATERYGAKALGEHLARHFDLEHAFVDLPNPV